MTSIEDWLAVQRLYAAYTTAVDAGDWDAWVELFVDDCEYKLQPRENHERGLPLATMWFLSKDMLRDRAYGIRETLFHDPYYQRHVVEAPSIVREDEGVLVCEANYAVFRTKRDGPSTVFNVGRYHDRVVRTPDGLRYARRCCVFDTELVPNSIIYPI
ncbi:aromatic-ring-hydroxylating dioxygenase subunit beta [Verticiella sediminum]|uniref:Aromatic-ring-hydroxylating dioxygenase subunit beta n=1 Tax=Verticiella sediminum TaxID=1247510 RepID=A0A556AL51_9BURK|nr:aromatic-ring-hydroxylating dioxygenase subunit beta [Verticiella sediminum]TSH93617.1 aromatic-ring-hydroxylating dioxygenase subunit beta [Verticiella sediminum]